MSKNMIFRLGVDASDFKQKMTQAGEDAESAGKRIKKTMTMNLGSEVSKIMGWGGSSSGITGQINIGNFDAARSQLSILKSYRDQLADAGFDDYQFGLVSERIKVLEFELNKYENTLRRTAAAEQEAASAADELGDETRKAEIPFAKASGKLQDMASSGRKLSIIPGFLRNIRSSANGSNSSLEKMVRTIRNVSVVSFGLRIVKGMFGELGSIVRQYISENAALQAQVNGLKSALGQALAPAINVVTNALMLAMPYVVGFSNAVGSLITSLFGSGWTTVATDANTAATAISAAGSAQKEFNRQLAGFDEITKLSAENAGGGGSGGVGGSGTSSSIPAVEAKTPTWLSDLTQQVKDAAAAGDFFGIGEALAGAINKGIDKINESSTSVGSKLSEWFSNGISTLEGVVDNFDWSGAGNSIAKNISDFFGGIDWSGISRTAGGAIRGVGTAIVSATDDAVLSFSERFTQGYTQAVQSGSDLYAAIGAGAGNAFSPAATWLKDNIFAPFINGLTGKDTRVEVTAEVKKVDTSRVSLEKVPSIANFTRYKSSLSPTDTTLGTTAIFSKSRNNLSPSATTFGSTANFTGARNNLNPSATIFGSTANFTGSRNSLSPSATTIGSTANFTRYKSSLFPTDTTLGTTAIFTSARNNLNSSDTTVAATAEITRANKKLSASDTIITATADVTSWRDNLGDKQLKFAADVTKGWRGNIEEHLGIETITTKLKVDTPEVSVKWSTADAPNGTASVMRPQFSVAYNELGAIFSKSTLLGHADGKWQIGGEAGREVLLNVDRHTWWMDLIADKVVERTAGGGLAEDRNITVNLVVDSKVLTSTVVRNVNAQARATGRNPLAAYI